MCTFVKVCKDILYLYHSNVSLQVYSWEAGGTWQMYTLVLQYVVNMQPYNHTSVCFQDVQDKVISPEKAEEAKLKARYPNLGNKPGGSDLLRKRLQKGVSHY